MHSNQYFLRSVKSNMNDNLIALAENNSSTQTHLQAQSADEIPVSSASILPTTTSQVFSTPLSSLLLYINLYCKILNHLL